MCCVDNLPFVNFIYLSRTISNTAGFEMSLEFTNIGTGRLKLGFVQMKNSTFAKYAARGVFVSV